MCSSRKSNENFSIFTFYESKQMSLTQDLRWSLGRSIALQLQRQTDLLLCTINCFLQWDHLPNMAVGDLAFYYTLYLWKFLHILLPGGAYSSMVWIGTCHWDLKSWPIFIPNFAEKMRPIFIPAKNFKQNLLKNSHYFQKSKVIKQILKILVPDWWNWSYFWHQF